VRSHASVNLGELSGIDKQSNKKVGFPLGTGNPEKARSIASVVFTPARGVIHSSFPLREAGGNDLQKMASKPLPPHSPPFTFRHVKRAYTPGNAIGRPSRKRSCANIRSFLCLPCTLGPNNTRFQSRGRDPYRNGGKLNRESPVFALRPCLGTSPRTLVTIFGVSRCYGFFSNVPAT
jgi:hypothetical protein